MSETTGLHEVLMDVKDQIRVHIRAEERSRKAKKAFHVVAVGLSAVLLLSIVLYFSHGTIDYGPAQRVSLQFDPMPLDQYVQSYDILVIARCDKVAPKTPWEGYTKYGFTTIEVLGGDFSEDRFESIIPRWTIGMMETGTNEYETGKTYLLPLTRVEEMFDIYYQPPFFGTVFCISDNRYEAGIDILNPPELKTAEEAQAYLVSAFNAAKHRTFPKKTRYEDPFEEFFEESTAIGKMKVFRIEKGIGKDIAYCECIELYKGQSSDLCYLAGTNLAHIAVLPETVAAGKEYIIGFNGDKISTKESVKEYSPELVERIAMRKNH